MTMKAEMTMNAEDHKIFVMKQRKYIQEKKLIDALPCFSYAIFDINLLFVLL